MNTLELSKYYVKNKNEFSGEDGHQKLLVGLKKYVTNIDDTNCKIVGIDVGCCIGEYIPILNDICMEQNKKILCFEPNPVNILELEPKINKPRQSANNPKIINVFNTFCKLVFEGCNIIPLPLIEIRSRIPAAYRRLPL